MTYTPVYPPYPHQMEAAAKMRGRRGFALLMGPRTGKTKVVLDDWAEMEAAGEVRDLLYLSRAGALYGQDAVEHQVTEHMPPDLRERTHVLAWHAAGGVGQRRAVEALLRVDPGRPRVLMVNVEALSSVARARELCRAFLTRPAVACVGESTCIKGGSRRTDEVLGLRDLALYRRIETGLVAPHSPLDLFYQFNFLDPKILRQHSWYGFRARYAVTSQVCYLPAAQRALLQEKGRRLPYVTVVEGYRNQDELRDLIEPHSYRVTLAQCREAPSAYRFRDVELTAAQRRMYREMREYATTAIEGADAHMTATVALTQVLRLHQLVCGYVVDEEGRAHDVEEARTAALLELCEEHGGKVVVWCAYDRNVRRVRAALAKAYGEGAVAAFWGGNAAARLEEERRFKGDAACRFMVATAAAGGMGREWSCADLAVYYSNSPNLEHREQSEMRIESARKFDLVTRVDLRAPEAAVDDRIIANLRAKIDSASTLQGDGYKAWLV